MASKPGPSERVDRGFLGETALRISRLLDVAGIINPQYNTGERIQPVVVVGDGTGPGMGAQRGRRFRASFQTSTLLHLTATADVIIEVVQFDIETFAVPLQIIVYYKGPNDPLGAEVPGGALQMGFIDRAASGSEAPPLLMRSGGAIGAQRLWRCMLATASDRHAMIGEQMLVAGSRLLFSTAGAGTTGNVCIFGRTF